MPEERCRHWWIDCGRRERKGKIETEYRCDICGAVEYMPVPAKVPGNGRYLGRRKKARKGAS